MAVPMEQPGSEAKRQPQGRPPQTAVVTGANTGIGFHVAGLLAARGYRVVLACRSRERGEAALASLKEQYGDAADVHLELLDLGSLASVRACAAKLSESYSRLELLVCNAGLNAASVPHEPNGQLTQDGVDVVYQSNFLGHFLLTLLLLQPLRAATGRVVSVTSVMHRSADSDFSTIRKVREPYTSFYGLSKLAQISAAYELHRRFGGAGGVAFHCVNPGGVYSDIWRDFPAWQRWLLSVVLVDSATAARTIVKACLCEDGAVPAAPVYWNGYYGAARSRLFEYVGPVAARDHSVASEPSDAARDPAIIAEVWRTSLEVLRSVGIEVSDEGLVKA